MGHELKVLRKYFSTGTAESEGNILYNAFVPLDDYLDILETPYSSPRILAGKKGSGKSAFLRFFQGRMKEGNVPVLLIRPKDIDTDTITGDSLGALTRKAEKALVRAISTQLGKQLVGMVVSEADQRLLKLAAEEGVRDEDWVQRALKALIPIGQAVTKIDFAKMAKGIDGVKDSQLRAAITSNLSESGKVFYLLIDDTDQIASPDQPGHLNRIWAFFLATRSLMEECPNIKCIITLRSEIWRRLEKEEAGQRDQVDHFRNLIYWLNPSEVHLSNIVAKRLELAATEIGASDYGNYYLPFFEGTHVMLPSKDAEYYRYWSDFIIVRARLRPRDAIQLVSGLTDLAIKDNSARITSSHAVKILPKYSSERIDDLYREVEDECSEIKEIIGSFTKIKYDEGSFKIGSERLLEHLTMIPSMFRIKLFSFIIKPDDKDDAFKLWRYLVEVGVIDARVSDTREKDGYRHVHDPDVVSKAKWNEMQKMTWEVNPAYRDFLLDKQKEERFFGGKPTGKKQI